MSEDLVIDNFRLTSAPIASGSTSQIYEVFDQDTNERYAMKLLLDEAFKVAENKAILKKEFKIANSFDHPNIVPVYAHRQTRKYAYFIMEHFGGANLKQIIRGDVVVVHSRLRKLLECVIMGLGHIHEKGWLHRDLKPDNIMMTKSTDVRIIDFSLSSRIPGTMTKLLSGKVKQIQGTRTYIAPEIIRKKHPSIASDMYSLGVTLFECLTGRPPFMGTTPNDLLIKHIQEAPPLPSAFNPNVSPEMDKLVSRMLSKRPEFRPTSAAELLSELRSVKIFKEDPDEYAKQRAAVEEEKNSFVAEGTIDSRADAARVHDKPSSASAKTETAAPKTPPKPTPAPAAKAAGQAPPAPQPVPPQQPQQPYYPQMPPGYPQQAPVPPYYQGGQPPGWGQAYPPQGYQAPAYPPAQPQQPVAQQPSAPVPPQNPQPPKQKAPAPPKQANQPEDDLPFADELPDIA